MRELDAYLKEERGDKIINPWYLYVLRKKNLMIKRERIRTYLDQELKKSDAPMLRNLWFAKIDDVLKTATVTLKKQLVKHQGLWSITAREFRSPKEACSPAIRIDFN